MSAVRPHPEGATLAVKAKPGAKKNAVLGVVNDHVRISVTAPPEDGRATRRSSKCSARGSASSVRKLNSSAAGLTRERCF